MRSTKKFNKKREKKINHFQSVEDKVGSEKNKMPIETMFFCCEI